MSEILKKILRGSAETTEYEWDLAVIGGGSGGLAAAKAASKLGAKVVLFDYVDPSPQGTKWGLGGTCVNVGCIPKKLMHRSARIGHSYHNDASTYGWKCKDVEFDWQQLVHSITMYVKSLNFGYRNGLRAAGVTYINGKASLSDAHTITYLLRGAGEPISVTSKYVLIATGGRPAFPSEEAVPGAPSLAISSDDLFYLKKSPGKTLVVGASYIALECAGFLLEMGFETKVAVRSLLLRGFDRQCAEKIGSVMSEMGACFIHRTVVTSIAKQESGRLLVHFSNPSFQPEEFDTVLYAVGRTPATASLGLDKLGIELTDTGHLVCGNDDSTRISNIFAIGDVVKGRPELTPVAIKSGEMLAARLFGGSKAVMDYSNIATTVFTPVEYGCCGLSEEDAIAKHGEDQIETYLFEFSPVEVSTAHWQKHARTQSSPMDVDMSAINLSKLVCLKSGGEEKVIGFHCVGLQAGETTQGYALAIKMGATKAMFDSVVGIHPTDAESFHSMSVTRRSGETWVASGGCGGGKCG